VIGVSSSSLEAKEGSLDVKSWLGCSLSLHHF
jgi:hypothetical protein